MLYLKNIEANELRYRETTIKFMSTLLAAMFASIVIWSLLWDKNKGLIHSVFGIICVCIGIATFLIIWNKREENDINDILGIGFFIVSVFDFMHINYYEGLIANDILKSQLSLQFSLLARLIEVVVLMIFSFEPYMKNRTINKNIIMSGIIIITSSSLYMLYENPNLVPCLYNDYGVTPIKVISEYLVVIIAILVLLKLNRNLQSEKYIKFRYIYISVLLIIPSEISLAFFNNLGSFWIVFGHVLKICSYYYLYKAVFQSLINYPYDKLSENNKKLSDILNAIPIAINTYNNDNKIDFVNKRFEELFKYSKENIIGLNCKKVFKLLRKAGEVSSSPLIGKLESNKRKIKNAIRSYLSSEGNEIKALINVYKINGGALVLASDAKKEQEIKNLNLQAEAILNSMTTPTIIVDVTGRITACNQAYMDLIEMEYNNIIGLNKCKLDAVLKVNINDNIEAFEKSYINNQISDCFIETPKGNKKQLRITSSSITNIYNEIVGSIYAIQDISKMKEEQSKLINQEKLALLGQMGATIVHETRNFLTTIKGNSQLIELYAKDKKIKNYAKKINSDTNEVNKIVSDFLTLSKPREAELEEVAFIDIVASMKNIIETSSLMKKVELILDLNYYERYILCDETQIRQVILNICKNAAESMEGRLNPVLHISTGFDENRKEVFINISDNGIGIDEKIIKKIGTPFFTTKKRGTGLGLCACYQIVKEHRGRIDIKSHLGKGTTFTISIPYIDEDLEDID